MPTKKELAIELAREGFYVFPLHENSKKPAIKNWQKLATRDEEQIEEWWTHPITEEDINYNIGICTTYFGDDKALLVVDVDVKHQVNGYTSLKQLASPLSPTRVSKTPTGGCHILYVVNEPYIQGAHVLGPGLDIRSSGGYIVAPGSEINGKPYYWKEQGERLCTTGG